MQQNPSNDIDTYLESILKAAGSSLRHYESYSKDAMRKAMWEILKETLERADIAINQHVKTLESYRACIERAEDAEALAHASELRIMEIETRLEHVRKILASTDIVSLPNDYPTYQIANDRMQRIKDLTLEGLGVIGRAEAAEAALVATREQAIRECAKIAFTWRTSETVRVGEYIANAILALASPKTGGAL